MASCKGIMTALIAAIGPIIVALIQQPSLPPPPPPLKGVYCLNKQSNADKDIKIIRVVVADTYTDVTFFYKNKKGREENIGIFPSGHSESIYIYDVEQKRRFDWVSIDDSIPVRPLGRFMKDKEELIFNIRFRRIDNDMSIFHIIEGDEDQPQHNKWNFYYVKLLF